MKISENTSVSMPVKNMIGIVVAVAMGVFAYTEVTSRLTSLETSRELFNADYRVGDIHVPKIQTTEALLFMAKDFISSILNGTKPDSDVESGVLVVEILEKAEYSIKNKGIEVILSQ